MALPLGTAKSSGKETENQLEQRQASDAEVATIKSIDIDWIVHSH